ncbi:MAG: hypothetical protein RBU21_24555, partial [FCB group bacterium]|nr:hypothetical protein [FCB group bacterium]
MRTAIALAIVLATGLPALTQELNVLSEDTQPRRMMAAYLGAITTAQLAARAERFEALADPADIAA